MSRRARFRESLEEARRVHVDARVLALHLLGTSRYVELTRLLFSALESGDVVAQTSALSLYQILVEPHRRDDPEAARQAGDYLTALRGLEIVPVTPEIARQAAEARARLGGRTERSVQIATAVDREADVFLTQASGIRRIAATRVVDLDDYVANSRKSSPDGSLGQK